MERTLLIIKPNAIEEHHAGEIISVLEKKGLTIINLKMETLSKEKAREFYSVHYGKPFYERLVAFMTSGPVIELVLEKEGCVNFVREIVGNTDPEKASDGTIRKLFGHSICVNAVHASDSNENAKREISIIFENLKK
jgi:nucleoside-diphosphate kinase